MNLRETLGRRLLLLDGATGTQLQARGLGSGQTPELWNIERREDMIAIHHSYYAAGADLVLSNTFGVNRLKLRNCPYSVDELVAAAPGKSPCCPGPSGPRLARSGYRPHWSPDGSHGRSGL